MFSTKNELRNFNGKDNLKPEIFIDNLSPSVKSTSHIGRFIQELSQPVIDWKKVDTIETLMIIDLKHEAEVRKQAIKSIENILLYGNLVAEAQLRCVKILDEIIN